MAARTATQLDVYTPSPGPDGLTIEYYRVAAATAGDTCTLTPKRGRLIQKVDGPVTSDLSTSGAATQVVLVFIGGAATSQQDVILFTQP